MIVPAQHVLTRTRIVVQSETNDCGAVVAHQEKKFPCHVCPEYEYWSYDDNEDLSLKRGAKVSDKPTQQWSSNTEVKSNNASGGDPSNEDKQKTELHFTSLLVSRLSFALDCIFVHNSNSKFNTGPLVGDGAPFSPIGQVQLQLLRDRTCSIL